MLPFNACCSMQSARQDPGTASRHSKGRASKVSGALVSPQTPPCHHCGQRGHNGAMCKFKDITCHYCHKTGHLQQVYRAKKTQSSGGFKSLDDQPRAHQVVDDGARGRDSSFVCLEHPSASANHCRCSC